MVILLIGFRNKTARGCFPVRSIHKIRCYTIAADFFCLWANGKQAKAENEHLYKYSIHIGNHFQCN